MLAARRVDTLRSWVGCQVRTVLEQSDLEGSHYIGFISSFQRLRSNPLDQAPEHLRQEALAYQAGLVERVVHLDEPLRSHRVWQAMSLIIHVGAARERARERAEPVLPLEVQLADLLDTSVALLTARPSTQTRAALRSAALVAVERDVYL